jgi:serralysin
MSGFLTGPWRNIEVANWTTNPGFQFTGNVAPDVSGKGYELTSDTAVAAAKNVEWMYDLATGQLHSYAEATYRRLVDAVTAKGLNADDEAVGSDAADIIRLAGGHDRIFARGGNDILDGGAGNDVLHGQEGDDTIIGGSGSDEIDGGAGTDTVVLDGLDGAKFHLFRYNGIVYSIGEKTGEIDRIVESEIFRDGAQQASLSDVRAFDPLRYAASHNDLALMFRTDAGAALSHYVDAGYKSDTGKDGFDAAQYAANYADIRAAFGADAAKATEHFLRFGVGEHRLAENPLDYIASFSDLRAAFKGGTEAQMKAEGLAHYAASGFAEGRREGISFDGEQYLKNYGDLRAAFGTDADKAAAHYINSGSAEHRLGADPLAYVASSPDLVRAFGGPNQSEATIETRGLQHFAASGYAENRSTDGFDVDAYLANYADLRAAFADGHGGYNDEAATLHFIQNGFWEGRTDTWLT